MHNYILVGAGGTGSHFIQPALAYLDNHHRDDDWQFAVIDGDAYEPGNLERQLFDPGLVKTNKAEAMAQMYNRYPIIAIPKFIGREDLAELMQDGDTIFIAADNFSVRALIEERGLELDNITIINAGNELDNGSVQIFRREDGKNVTPRLTFLHPEIAYTSDTDRAPMTCAQAAALPGGGQLMLANAKAANWMLDALWRIHEEDYRTGWTEVKFDLRNKTTYYLDRRDIPNWSK